MELLLAWTPSTRGPITPWGRPERGGENGDTYACTGQLGSMRVRRADGSTRARWLYTVWDEATHNRPPVAAVWRTWRDRMSEPMSQWYGYLFLESVSVVSCQAGWPVLAYQAPLRVYVVPPCGGADHVFQSTTWAVEQVSMPPCYDGHRRRCWPYRACCPWHLGVRGSCRGSWRCPGRWSCCLRLNTWARCPG